MPGPLNDLQALERFVAENDDLITLETRIGRFNIFDALGVVNAELRHSNFLAWLLDPGESHGLGGLFLRAVLMDLLRQTPPDQRLFSPIMLDGGELRGIEVRREWRNIDLLITCDDPSFVIAIENKIGSSEHSNQLARYRQTIAESSELARFEKKQFVYLTKSGDEPSEEDWTIYSYADLHRVLSKVRANSGDQMGDDVRAFLDHYLRLIGSRFMDDPEIIELCKEIYKNHRQAIDLIVEHNRGSDTAITAEQVIKDHDHDWKIYPGKSGGRISVVFQPRSWCAWLPYAGKLRVKELRQRWLFFRIADNKGKLMLSLRVNPTQERELRHRVIQTLIDHADDIGASYPTKNKQLKEPGAAVLSHGNVHRVLIGKYKDEISYEELSAMVSPRLDELIDIAERVEQVLKPFFERYEKPTD